MPNIPFASVCLLLGAFMAEWAPFVPNPPVLFMTAASAGVAAIYASVRTVALVVTGMSVMAIAMTLQLDERLDPSLQSETIGVVVTISEFPVTRNGQVNLLVTPRDRDDLPSRLRLSWQAPAPMPRLGETWRLDVRLRRPSGYANPGGFDYEGWLLRNKIGATGYVVRDGHHYVVHGSPTGIVARIRRGVVERLQATLPTDEAAAVLKAIVVGARHEITREHWDAYAATGTSHLMAISGLHIGLAAGATFLLAWGVLALIPVRWNARDLALITALCAALGYTVLSGFAVPARRACVMLLIAGFLVLRRREIPAMTLLGITAISIFLTDPLTTLTPGFRMSFAAVAVLFVVARHHVVLQDPGSVRKLANGAIRLGHVQVGLLAGLLPLTVVLFERFAVAAPLVNMAVLPIFNAVTVPFAIAGAVLDGPVAPAGDHLLHVAHRSVELVLAIVSLAEARESLSFRVSVPVNLLVLLLPLLHILLPAGWPGRRLVLLAAIAIIGTRPEPVPAACFRYHVLDVGQGLAVVVETREHALLFDTGPAFLSGSSTAETVVQPFLWHRGIARLDVVVISHGDLDHAGGIHWLVRSTAVGSVLSGETLPSMGQAQIQCAAGQTWRWDDVQFRVLHPRRKGPWQNNNASCVVEVAAGARRLLLTGDIEAPVETLLAYRHRLQRSNVVVVPHHGSRTSSSAALVNATTPDVAIVSAGRSNRWGFPKDEVVARWRAAGAAVVNTGRHGAVSQLLCPNRAPGQLETAGSERRKIWHEVSPGPP